MLYDSLQTAVHQISLEKPSSGGGLGISLVTAESGNVTGIYIKTVTPGGLADLDGRLQAGDKILQVLEQKH